jgi:hypothetical protein
MSKTGSGFNKKPAPLTMQVNADEISAMQQGYEAQIARQRASLDRMANLLEQRTQDVTDHMRRANESARWSADNVDDLTAVAMTSTGDKELTALYELVPLDFTASEDDTKSAVISQYIKYLRQELRDQKGKQLMLVRQAVGLRVWVDNRTQGVGPFKSFVVDPEEDGFATIRRYTEYLEYEVIQARNNARHNAKVANKAQAAIEVGDDTPPWEKDEAKPFVQPATHDHDVLTDEQPLGESETVSWEGENQLPSGEQRPGSF